MTRAKRQLRAWAYPILMAVMAIGIMVEASFLIPVVQRQAKDAEAGLAARERQQQVFPVSCKLYLDAKRRGVITAEDLTVFESPRRCPR